MISSEKGNSIPLDLDNTSWHDTVKFTSQKTSPILEVRFMGLKGVFKYMLDEMQTKTGASFLHLDGESI